MTNEELNKLEAWKGKACSRCKRKYPDTILNIEGYLHHTEELVCLDRKSCKRASRKG